MNNREIIEEIYKLYEQKMFYIAFSILKNESAAEDAVQDAFIKLINNISRIKNPDSDRTKAYILTTIKNTTIDIYRKRKRDLALYDDNHLIDITYHTVNDTSDIDIKDLIIREELNRLPHKYKEIILLHIEKEISIQEIAKIQGISYDAARKRYERGIKALRKNVLVAINNHNI